MNKMSINDFPSLDGVSLIPTKTLELMIDIYNKAVQSLPLSLLMFFRLTIHCQQAS